MEVHESRHFIAPSGGVAGEIRRTGLASIVLSGLERRWNRADAPGASSRTARWPAPT
jgi:hypothetical protein